TSKTSSLREVCGDAAYYIDPYNVDDLAGALYKVWNEKGTREKLRTMGLDRAKLFSWEDSKKKHVKLFEELVRLSR
ncbi:MAG: glycosyltransferase family 1 protein, partial [Aquificaceae bacterium]